MSTVYLNIGSNIGDRHAQIEQAVALIHKAYPEAMIRRSHFIESEAWGYESPNTFLNLGIALDMESQPDPWQLLSTLQHIEKSISQMSHRRADGSYCDRAIDIDIIAIDDLEILSPSLQIPHPRASQRPFVTIPLKELGKEL